MTRLVHSPEAAQDLEELVDFLLLNRPEYAVETVDLVLDALSVLERHPLMGRPVAQRMPSLPREPQRETAATFNSAVTFRFSNWVRSASKATRKAHGR